jgi:hypothetical protein
VARHRGVGLDSVSLRELGCGRAVLGGGNGEALGDQQQPKGNAQHQPDTTHGADSMRLIQEAQFRKYDRAFRVLLSG